MSIGAGVVTAFAAFAAPPEVVGVGARERLEGAGATSTAGGDVDVSQTGGGARKQPTAALVAGADLLYSRLNTKSPPRPLATARGHDPRRIELHEYRQAYAGSDVVTSPVEEILVRCPECSHVYEDWYRASLNLTLESFSDDYMEKASTATCPKCGHKVELGGLVVSREDDEREVWEDMPPFGELIELRCHDCAAGVRMAWSPDGAERFRPIARERMAALAECRRCGGELFELRVLMDPEFGFWERMLERQAMKDQPATDEPGSDGCGDDEGAH